MELNSGRYLLSCETVKSISATFADTEVKNYFSIYHTNTKKLVQFFQDTKKLLEMKLLTCEFVSLAA